MKFVRTYYKIIILYNSTDVHSKVDSYMNKFRSK